MTHDPPASVSDTGNPGFRVEAPRASDAVGLALRDAFDRDLGIPEDMCAMLRLLNGTEPHPGH